MVRQRKVLVADDDRITREIIGGILTRAGHEVVFAEDGKSAVEKASTEKPRLHRRLDAQNARLSGVQGDQGT